LECPTLISYRPESSTNAVQVGYQINSKSLAIFGFTSLLDPYQDLNSERRPNSSVFQELGWEEVVDAKNISMWKSAEQMAADYLSEAFSLFWSSFLSQHTAIADSISQTDIVMTTSPVLLLSSM
jgi:hypothetical protein